MKTGLVDHLGNPFSSQAPEEKKVARAWNSFISALGGTEHSPMQRARDPFGNHVWVYAAVMSIAVNSSQIPFEVYTETENKAKMRVIRKPRYGYERSAMRRFLQQNQRSQGCKIRGVEAQYDHPIARLMYRPNPLMSESQMWETTTMWMSLRGACMWLKTRKDGTPVSINEVPAYIWPMCPDYFTPVLEGNVFVGWEMHLPSNDATGYTANKSGYRIPVDPHEVCLFKYSNPADPLGWVSPLTAAASGISLDMAAIAYNRAVLLNGAKPGGLLLHEDEIDEKEETKLRKYWKDRHEGPQNANKLAILTGAFKYIDIGLGPKDMEYLEQRRWDREEILAALRVTKSSLSLTEGNNYATQLSQDRNYWDKCLMPLMRMYESVIDRTLFYNEPDTTFGAFDFTKVEALRAGLLEKVQIVVQLTGPQIRMPPAVAFEVVGLDVPAYSGNDICLVSKGLASAEDVAAGLVDPKAGPGNSDPNNPSSQNPDTGQPEGDQTDPERTPRPSEDKAS